MKQKTNLKELSILIFLILSIISLGVFYYFQSRIPKRKVLSGDLNIEYQELEKILRDDLKIYAEGFDGAGNSFSFYKYSNEESDYDPQIAFIEYNIVEESYLVRKKDGKRTHEFKRIRNIGCTYLEGLFKVVAGNSEEAIEIFVAPVKEILREK